MKKKVLFLTLVCAFIMLLAIGAGAANVKPSVELENGVKISPIDDIIYLPSHVDITKVKINFGATAIANITLDGVKVVSGDVIDISPYVKLDKENKTAYYEVVFVTDSKYSPNDTVKFYRANKLPTVFINTSIGSDQLLNHATDASAGVSMIDKNGRVLVDVASSEVRTRGNSTPTYMKKPFQIKFESGIDVLGMGKSKTWVLLANYLDQSYTRNAMLYKLAKDMGMGASDFQNVEVYVDGKYQGIYLLCEKVNIDNNRVDITELEKLNDQLNPTYSTQATTVTEGAVIESTALIEYKYVNDVVNPADITGGYLIELDNNNKGNKSSFGSYFITKTDFGENFYVIKSPEYCSKEQVEYIATLFAQMEEAMASKDGKNSLGKHYTEYIDINSFGIAYIMAELGRNYDAGSASIFFNKDADVNGEVSKIFKGPLWDCDNTLGNIHRGDAQNQKTMWAKNRTPWNMLTQHADFNEVVRVQFEKAYDLIYDMLDKGGFVDQQIESIGYSAQMDRIRWSLDSEETWPLYEDGSVHWFQMNGNAFPVYKKFTDFVNNTEDTAMGYLCVALMTRTEYLVDEWNCEVTQRTRVLNDPIIIEQEPVTPPAPETPSTPPQEESTESSTESTEESSQESVAEPNDDEEEELNFFEKIIKAIISFFKKLFSKLF